jgi:hypothetical protein
MLEAEPAAPITARRGDEVIAPHNPLGERAGVETS